MESLSVYLTADPKPLIGLTSKYDGEPSDILSIISSLLNASLASLDNPENLPGFSFRSLSKTHEFRMKKDPKAIPSYDGILKREWLRKHRELMPSVVVSLWGFNTDLKINEWAAQEAIIDDSFKRVKACLDSREARIVLLLLRTGNTVLDKDVLDDRIASIKKRLGLDSKNFVYISSVSELNYPNNSQIFKKIAKSIREYSLNYYTSHYKRCKQLIKLFPTSLSPLDALIVARLNFKTAYYAEVLGQKQTAMRHYHACFQILSEQLNTLGMEWIEQLKAVCEWCNFKVCSHLLSSGNLKEAALQFRCHVHQFFRAVTLCSWRHFHWLSVQYIIFSQLLDQYNVDSSTADADRGYYAISAAKYATQRLEAYNAAKSKIHTTSDFTSVAAKFKGLVSTVSRYIGSPPDLKDPNLIQSSPSREELDLLVYIHYLENEEQTISESCRNLIAVALNFIPPTQTKRITHANSLLGSCMVLDEQYSAALPIYVSLSDSLTNSKWIEPAIPYLQMRMKCAFYIGNLKEYLIASLVLYTCLVRSLVPLCSTDKKIELNRDTVSVLSGCLSSASSNPSSILNQPDYGRFVADLTSGPPLKYIPGGIVLDMSGNMNLFDIEVKFSSKSMNIGSSVRLSISIKSKFLSALKFKKMSVRFFDEGITKTFVNSKEFSASGVDSLVDAPEIPAGLVFQPEIAVEFKFSVFVPETYMQSISGDTLFGVQYVMLELDRIDESGSELPVEDGVVMFKVPCTPTDVIQKLDNKAKVALNIKDFTYLFRVSKESLVLVMKPRPLVEMVYPTPINSRPYQVITPGADYSDPTVIDLLLGPIQRINLVFRTGDSHVIGGRFYLSSDLIPKSPTDSLFWYPDLESTSDLYSQNGSKANVSNASDDEQLIDKIRFHPFLLNSSFQPAQPLIVPDQTPGSFFYIPIFVRSEQIGMFKFKFRLEYISVVGFSSYLSKEYEVRVQFHRGLQISHSPMSKRLANCGIGRDPNFSAISGSMGNTNHSTIVKGDSLSMNVAIMSLETLKSSIEIKSCFINHSENILEDNEWISNDNFPQYFEFSGNNTGSESKDVQNDKIRHICNKRNGSQSHSMLSLKKGEVFVGNFVFTSVNELKRYETPFENRRLDDETTHVSGVAVSFGETIVNWRIKDYDFFKPFDLSSISSSRSNSKYGSSNSNNASSQTIDLSWIPSIAKLGLTSTLEPAGTSDVVLNKSIYYSRLCSSLFPLPAIHIVDSPFEIFADVPNVATMGEEVQVVFHIYNRMFSAERIIINCPLQQDILITGPTNCSIDIPIQAWTRVKITMMPIKCGQIPLPNIVLLWERFSNTTKIAAPLVSSGSPINSSGKTLDDKKDPAALSAASSVTAGIHSNTSNASLVEVGYPSDLRYMFVKPCDVNY